MADSREPDDRVDEREPEEHTQVRPEPGAVQQHPPPGRVGLLRVEPSRGVEGEKRPKAHVDVAGLAQVIEQPHDRAEPDGRECVSAAAEVAPSSDQDRRSEPEQCRQRRGLCQHRESSGEPDEGQLRASQPARAQERGGEADHRRHRYVGQPGGDVVVEVPHRQHDDDGKCGGEAAVARRGPAREPRDHHDEQDREREAQQAAGGLVESDQVPDEALEDEEEGALVVGGGGEREVKLRPMLSDQPGPGAERHRVPLAVGEEDGDDDGEGDQNQRCGAERTSGDRQRPG